MIRIVARDSPRAAATAAWVATDQRDVRRLDRDVRTGADGDPEVGLGEGRRVVDAVPDHRDGTAATLEPLDDRRLGVGQDLGDDLVGWDPDLVGDRLGGGAACHR